MSARSKIRIDFIVGAVFFVLAIGMLLRAMVLDVRTGLAYLGELGSPARHEFSEETGRKI